MSLTYSRKICSAVNRLDDGSNVERSRVYALAIQCLDNPSYADIDVEANVPDMANEAIFTNLWLKTCANVRQGH